MALCCGSEEIEDSTLEGWAVIGSGGFGQIYKARHRLWGCDVAIKLLHYDDGTSSSLRRELDMMYRGSNPFVIHVHGLFKGRPPFPGSSVQLGLVMEFMERGSLASLQNALQSPPPWPLSVRLTHQVALGINFLHSLSPAVLHLDLKPSNVLLDSSLNAKLTDFGLAKFYHSVTRGSRKNSEEEGGTISYMPPEAFDLSYSPTRASDIYSYGILLWSIVTGKQPYPNALSSIVRFRIPEGDRPSLDEIRCQAAGRAGLARLTDLMQACWNAKSIQRPSALACTIETEELLKMHKHAIADAVHEVLKKLEGNESDCTHSNQAEDLNGEEKITERLQKVSLTQAPAPARAEPANTGNDAPTARFSVQEMAGGQTPNQREKTKDSPQRRLINDCQVDQARSSGGYKGKPSSVHLIHSSPSSTMMKPPQDKAGKNQQPAFNQHLKWPYQRQSSSPAPNVNMHFSDVTGVQVGNNNSMYIYTSDSLERRRHPTAPSTVPVTPHHNG